VISTPAGGTERWRILNPKPYHGILNEALAGLQRDFPAFQGIEIVERWAGMIDATPDAVPVIDRIEKIPGLFVASGFSGHGFKLSPVVGRLLAQSALGLPTDVPLAPYALDRFASGQLLAGRYGTGAVS
jgi:glycine/D-amino acid oxidase-like deaminating enzyme